MLASARLQMSRMVARRKPCSANTSPAAWSSRRQVSLCDESIMGDCSLVKLISNNSFKQLHWWASLGLEISRFQEVVRLTRPSGVGGVVALGTVCFRIL